MKPLVRNILIGSIAIAALIAIIVFFYPVISFLSNSENCDENSKAVAFARSLSQERLNKLFTDIKELKTSGKTLYYIYDAKGAATIPTQFKDLNLKKIDGLRQSKFVKVMLEGCFDTFVFLYIYGVDEGEAKIVLTWGEGPFAGEQVLWKKNG